MGQRYHARDDDDGGDDGDGVDSGSTHDSYAGRQRGFGPHEQHSESLGIHYTGIFPGFAYTDSSGFDYTEFSGYAYTVEVCGYGYGRLRRDYCYRCYCDCCCYRRFDCCCCGVAWQRRRDPICPSWCGARGWTVMCTWEREDGRQVDDDDDDDV